jgi:hypothetical protein
MIENISAIMSKLFDRMTLDVASSFSVIVGIIVFIYKKQKSEKRYEVQEFNKAMERMRFSLDSIKNNFLKIALDISDATERYKCNKIDLFELKKNSTKHLGKLLLFLLWQQKKLKWVVVRHC